MVVQTSVPDEHEEHEAPPLPQKSIVVPARQTPDESQHPLGQLLELQLLEPPPVPPEPTQTPCALHVEALPTQTTHFMPPWPQSMSDVPD